MGEKPEKRGGYFGIKVEGLGTEVPLQDALNSLPLPHLHDTHHILEGTVQGVTQLGAAGRPEGSVATTANAIFLISAVFGVAAPFAPIPVTGGLTVQRRIRPPTQRFKSCPALGQHRGIRKMLTIGAEALER